MSAKSKRTEFVDSLVNAQRMQNEMERVTSAGRRFLDRSEKILKPRGKSSRRIRESIDEVSATLDAVAYEVTHFQRPTCALVTRSFTSRRRAYVYIAEMLAQGIIRNGDPVSISTETIVNFK